MMLLEDVLFTQLKIPKDFLRNHMTVAREKLRCASADLEREYGDIFAINQCLHLASSVVLKGTTCLAETLANLRRTDGLKNQDPTTLVTVAMLYYLLRSATNSIATELERAATDADKAKVKEQDEKLKRLGQRFDRINWLIGRDAMQVLGIEPL